MQTLPPVLTLLSITSLQLLHVKQLILLSDTEYPTKALH